MASRIPHVCLIGLSALLASCVTNLQGSVSPEPPRMEAEIKLPGATGVASGGAHACAVTADRTVVCWGDNRYGQLGDGSTTDASTPVKVSRLSYVAAVAAGEWHTCAILTTGQVKCWGANAQGQLGDPSLHQASIPVLVAVGPATQIAAGRSHNCVLLINGTVICWGDNRTSQTGVQRAPRAKPSRPVIVPHVFDAVSVAAGDEHSCAVQADGQLLCWGDNHFGQLGTGIQEHHSFPPSPVPIADRARAVTAGRRHTCALLRDGTVECWGKGFEGQLGDGQGKDSLTPVRVLTTDSADGSIPLEQVTAVTAGSQHTCALREDGRVYCWGSNDLGQLGRVNEESATRAVFSGLSDVLAVSAGGWHTCAIRRDGGTICLGQMQPAEPMGEGVKSRDE
jgi:alpha-tubulin suppressor-like RCC1 family protein